MQIDLAPMAGIISALEEKRDYLKEYTEEFCDSLQRESRLYQYIQTVFKIIDIYISVIKNADKYSDIELAKATHLFTLHTGILNQIVKVERVIINAIK